MNLDTIVEDAEVQGEISRHRSSCKFNDIFGNKADYTTGLFYQGRRSYLQDVSSFEPPDQLKTKTQMRRTIIMKQQMQSIKTVCNPDKFQLSFNKAKEDNDERETTHHVRPAQHISKAQARRNEAAAKSKAKKSSTAVITINKYSTTDSSSWEETHQAGCRIWVNKSTGEVSTVCPWEDEGGDTVGGIDKLSIEELEEMYYTGTGAMVYDGSEVNELLDYLDRLESRKVKLKSAESK